MIFDDMLIIFVVFLVFIGYVGSVFGVCWVYVGALLGAGWKIFDAILIIFDQFESNFFEILMIFGDFGHPIDDF